MIHLDLFSGIGGFAYAADQVFGDVEHIFCDNDKFCQQVLKKHWPDSEIYDDIKTFTNSVNKGLERQFGEETPGQRGQRSGVRPRRKPFLLTGGFPCQPFSAAGVRRGTADDRYLWPEMYKVIRAFKPEWVIAENVRGLLTWEQGVVFEQVCTDLEATGYAVQAFIIPAVAVNAPHRRDRIWWVARNTEYAGHNGSKDRQGRVKGSDSYAPGTDKNGKPKRPAVSRDAVKDPLSQRSRGRLESSRQILERQSPKTENERPDWEKDWLEVATELCGVDDGFPKGMDRANQIKAYGNAIVPQVAIEIMKGISNAG